MLSVWSFTRHGRVSASRPRIAASSSMRLLVVSGSPPTTSRSFAPVLKSTAQPPGPGLPRHAPSVNISTSGSSLTSDNELARQLEGHALGRVIRLLLGHFEAGVECLYDLAHEQLGRGGAGGEAERGGMAEPLPVDVRRPLDQSRRHAEALRDLGEALRIAAVRSADHQHLVAFGGDSLDR